MNVNDGSRTEKYILQHMLVKLSYAKPLANLETETIDKTVFSSVPPNTIAYYYLILLIPNQIISPNKRIVQR